MAYARLDSPLRNLTLSMRGYPDGHSYHGLLSGYPDGSWSRERTFQGYPDGQSYEGLHGYPDGHSYHGLLSGYPDGHSYHGLSGCASCGLGDVDPLTGELIPPPDVIPMDPSNFDLPLPMPMNLSIDISSPWNPTVSPPTDVPWIGNEFQNVGPDEYINIQTGQSVTKSMAQAITAATGGGVDPNIQVTATTSGVNLTDPVSVTDPTSGRTYAGTLTAAAQAMKATGTLVDSAGKLTAQGRQLANSGNLIAPPTTAQMQAAQFNPSSMLTTVESWFSGKTAGIPNMAIVAVVLAGATVLPGMMSSGPKRRRR